MADVIGNLRTTIEVVDKLASSANVDKPLQIYSKQCQLLAHKASGTMLILDEFLNLLRDVDSHDIPDWNPAAMELYRVMKDAQELINDCCCGDIWLKVTIDRGNLKESIARLLHDIDWHASVLCSVLVGKKDVLGKSICVGDLAFADNFKLMAAEKHDLTALRKLLKVSHVCEEEMCAGLDVGGCLANRVLKKLEGEEKRLMVVKTLNIGSPLLLWVHSKHLPKVRSLGMGSFGKVQETTWLGLKLAKKIFKNELVHKEMFKQEITVMAELNHPNVLRVICCFADSKIGIVMELMDKSLFDLLRDFRDNKFAPGALTPFPLLQSVDLMLQIAEGLRYLHSKRLAHRDVKSQNILLKFVGPRKATKESCVGNEFCSFVAKVADFGLTKMKNTSTQWCHQTQNVGTRQWKAPELLKYPDPVDEPPPSSRFHPMKLDVYSFGIVCSEILTGKEPYPDKIPSQIAVRNGERPKLPADTPQRLEGLIQLCWHGNPRMRPVLDTICTELRYMKGLLLRDEMEALQDTAFDIGEASVNIGAEVKVQGPWGGNGGGPFFDGVVTSIKSITVRHTSGLQSFICHIEIEYDVNGFSFMVDHGEVLKGSKAELIRIDDPHEYVTKVEGSYGDDVALRVGGRTPVCVVSLTISTSLKTCGPFGGDGGTPFSTDNGKVVGFFGRSGMALDQIGFFMTAPEQM